MKTVGIKFEKYANGSIKSVIFNYKQHGEAIKPLLQEMGAIEEENSEEEKYYTLDEARAETKKMIRKWWKK